MARISQLYLRAYRDNLIERTIVVGYDHYTGVAMSSIRLDNLDARMTRCYISVNILTNIAKFRRHHAAAAAREFVFLFCGFKCNVVDYCSFQTI